MLHSALLNVMIAAARKTARALKRDFGEIENLQVSMKVQTFIGLPLRSFGLVPSHSPWAQKPVRYLLTTFTSYNCAASRI